MTYALNSAPRIDRSHAPGHDSCLDSTEQLNPKPSNRKPRGVEMTADLLFETGQTFPKYELLDRLSSRHGRSP
jgi:hypothetical protein